MNFADYSFHCEIQDDYNGWKLKGVKPDADGFYTIPIGCIGAPTRSKVMYEPKTMIAALRDPESRFQICLRDGNLAGERDHPVILKKDDMWRLFMIDNKNVSHYFKAIWTDEPISINQSTLIPIMGKLKPTGPYGPALERELNDDSHNTSFSMRTLCVPMESPVPNSPYTWRAVQNIVTFDNVFAPGYSNTSKRYAPHPGNESFQMDITRDELQSILASQPGMEGDDSIKNDIKRLLSKHDHYTLGSLSLTGNATRNGILTEDNELKDYTHLFYTLKRN